MVMSLSGMTLNINAQKAYVFFPPVITSEKRVKPSMVHTSGGSDKHLLTECRKYKDGKISRKELVNSLAGYLENASN